MDRHTWAKLAAAPGKSSATATEAIAEFAYLKSGWLSGLTRTDLEKTPSSLLDADGREELLIEIKNIYHISPDDAERLVARLSTEVEPRSPALFSIILDSELRSDFRAVAARILVRSLYPERNSVGEHSLRREQTKCGLLVEDSLLLAMVLESVPPLVRLGVVEALDDVSDFETLRRLFHRKRDEPNVSVRRCVDEILSELD